jgi:hypothetical protein
LNFASAAALGLSLACAAPAQADRDREPGNDLPRHLAMAEPRRTPTLEVRVEVVVPAPDSESYSLAAALHPVAERMFAAPNPYASFDAPTPASLGSDGAAPPTPTADGERRWFQMEDSGDWMGIRLNQDVLAGLQVEFIGPAEDPKSSRKIVFMRTDPFHQRFLLTTAGVTLRF